MNEMVTIPKEEYLRLKAIEEDTRLGDRLRFKGYEKTKLRLNSERKGQSARPWAPKQCSENCIAIRLTSFASDGGLPATGSRLPFCLDVTHDLVPPAGKL
jgi:hypothetical protein